MCATCATTSGRHLLAKESDAERSARRTFVEEFARLLEQWHGDVVQALEAGEINLLAAEATRRTVNRTLDAHRDAIQGAFETLWTDGGEAARAATVRRHDLDVDPGLSEQVARELRGYGADAWSETSETMVREIAGALREAHDAGLGAPEMERILREEVFPDMTAYEAERAARTSATGAAGRGAVSGIRDAGAPGKEWLATGPPYDRTRESHEEIDGQVVPVGAKFTTGAGNQAWWPGDPRLPPEDFIFCRCSVAPAWELP